MKIYDRSLNDPINNIQEIHSKLLKGDFNNIEIQLKYN